MPFLAFSKHTVLYRVTCVIHDLLVIEHFGKLVQPKINPDTRKIFMIACTVLSIQISVDFEYKIFLLH